MREIATAPLEGQLNIHRFLQDGDRVVLERLPRENRQILTSIHNEYGFMGFNDLHGTVRRRTPAEQVKFASLAASHGLSVLTPLNIGDGKVYYPYLSNILMLDEYLPTASLIDAQVLVYRIFDDLYKAHRRGIIYGDRWSHNMLVLPDARFVHVDFDLEISGPPAKEFEIAQTAYYILSAGKRTVLETLSRVMIAKNWFQVDWVELFLRGHANYFSSTKYGGIHKETEELIRLLKLQE